MIFLFSVVAGMVPMLIYPLFLYLLDRYEKEPLGLVAATFIWGFMPAALFALITQVMFDIPMSVVCGRGDLGCELFSASIVAPVTEEVFKGLAVLLIFLFARREFDSVFDGILYGSVVGFGFAAIENILYFYTEATLPEATAGSVLSLFFFRAVLFGLNHAFFTSLTGMGFAVARLTRGWLVKLVAPLLGVSAAIIAHSIHNAGATLSGQSFGTFLLALLADWFGVLFVFVIILISIRRERGWLVEQLKEEVKLGTISESQYAVVSSLRRRAQVRGESLGRGDGETWNKLGRFYRAATELAYKKHQNARAGERGATSEMIASLRKQVAALSQEF